ncbi:phage tail protein [Acinetobacter bereziniae]|uniref:phage tail protein n=1 Tax=Acinetobacter bereziniae TaxID=106648 RepID=UPI00125F6F30|nr:phage tail protein [Acinetobacter bereziniae]
MGGSKSQTVGYTYFKGLMAVIGNRIERLLDINPDKKGWILTADQKEILKDGQGTVNINLPSLFGGDKKEGGWVGAIDVYIGDDQQPQNAYLANQIDEDVSAYPNLSYLVFHAQDSLDKGFQLVSMSGMMKEFMLWVKRIHVKNDGSLQWYDPKAEIGYRKSNSVSKKPDYDLKIKNYFSFTRVEDGSTTTPVSEILETNYIKNNADFDPKNSGQAGGTSGWLIDEPHGGGEYSAKSKMRLNGFGEYILELEIDMYNYIGNSIEHNFSGAYSNELISETTNGVLIVKKYKVVINTSSDFSVENFASNPVFSENDNGYVSYSLINIKYVKFIENLPSIDYNFPDINPIHKIREILTDYTAMGKPESDINDQNFRLMADRIFDESLGISWCIQQKSCKEALEELEYHIEGGVRINRQTGLYEVILFRDDLLDLDDALHFDESNIKSFQPDIINAEDQINAVNVSFYDRENIKDSSFSLSDVGSFHTIDHENAEDLKFPYFMNRRNAETVANWKLKQLSTMAWKGTFTTGKYEARKLNKYDVVLLSWKSKNIVNLPVRVMNINLGNGRDNTVTLDFVEVVPYSNISYSSINVDPNPNQILPPQQNSSIVFEMPYFEAVQRMGQTSVDAELSNNPEIGYLMAAAIKPQSNSLNALLFTDGGTGIYTNFEESGVVEYCAACYLDQNISRTDSSFAVKSVKDLSRVKLGTLVQVGEELLVYQDYDTETKILTVKRGALDTIPKPHLKDAVFYFWDDSSGLDQTVYMDGETVHAKVLTTTPSGVENLGTSAVRILEINGRANRPYPPANVRINGVYYPETTIVSNDIEVTWVDRNRLQQTGGSILGFYDDGVTRESNVTYSLELSSENVVLYSQENLTTNSHSIPSSVLVPNKAHRLKIWSVRDGFKAYQTFEHSFFVEAVSLILTATAYKDRVVGSTVPIANINVDVDESLSANVKFDGLSISGKSLPNSSITIEVDE